MVTAEQEAGAATPATSLRTLRWAAFAALLAAASYLLARFIGLGPPAGPWAYWPIHGLLCGLLFRRPLREWAYIVAAAIASQVLTIFLVRGDLAGGATPFGAMAGAAQAMLGAWILRRTGQSESPLESPRVLAWFVAIGVAFAPLATSPFAAAAFSMGLGVPFRDVWGPLFVGNSLGMLLFAPLTMQRWRYETVGHAWLAGTFEAIACLTALTVVTIAAFAGGPFWLQYVALPYAVFPLLAWSALRSGPRWTAVSIVTLATIAAWSTARGSGPFIESGRSVSNGIFHLEAYLAFVAFTGLLLSALTEQRRRSFVQTSLDEAIRKAFFESSSALIALKDVTGRYLMVNRAAEEAYRVPREGLIGREPADFLDRESARTVAAHDQRILERGEPLVFEETLGDGDRERRFLMTRFPIRDYTGAIRYLGMIGQDVTMERELSARLQRAQRVELVGQLAAGLAHDINNLLFVLVGNAEHLRELGDRTAEEREIIQEMTNAGAQATRLTARLLALGKRQPLVKALVNVDETLRELTPLLRALVHGGLDLTISLDATGATVLTDPTAIEQIVLNLVSNARDAIHGDGHITIASKVTGTEARMLRLLVTDTGSGMDAATIARVYEPFFTTKGDARGTGLGLYTTAMLVQQAGGTIEVESAPGEGTTFTVELPVQSAPE
jgi:PAS domain S-box-containing protein